MVVAVRRDGPGSLAPVKCDVEQFLLEIFLIFVAKNEQRFFSRLAETHSYIGKIFSQMKFVFFFFNGTE